MAKSRAFKITGTLLKFIGIFIVLAVYCTLMWRMCTMSTPKSIETISVDKALADAYAEQGEALVLFTQDYDEFTTAERNYGYFAVVETLFIPSIDQLQIIFRYNDSTLAKVKGDQGLETLVSRGDEYFDISVVKTVDTTPENKDDNALGIGISKERIAPTGFTVEKTQKHTYFRYVFDGVSTEGAEGLFVDVYYVDDIDYGDVSYGSILIYESGKENIPVALTKSIISAIEDYE